MNNSNQFLSFPRLGKLIHHEININKQVYAMIIPVAMISFMAVLFFSFSVSNQFSASGYVPFLFIGYFIMCIFLTGKSFPALKNKYSSTIYLTLPASSFEKLFVQWIFKLAIPLLLYPLIFWLTAYISVEIYQMFTSVLGSSSDAGVASKPIEKFTYNTFGIFDEKTETLFKVMMISLYIAVPSVFLLGSISFNKWGNIKAPIGFFFLGFLYVCFLVFLSHILEPDATQGFQINLNLGPMVIEDTPLIVLIAIGYISLIPIIAWTASYWKLNEREV
ncbi:MAG TPA: hypothetical protein VK921_19715 [Anditalea sp.]|nr:hypothetical protein [Anditalea sp.]